MVFFQRGNNLAVSLVYADVQIRITGFFLQLFKFFLLSVLEQHGIVDPRVAHHHFTGDGRLGHKNRIGRKAVRIHAVLPCVVLPVQPYNPVAFRLRQEARASGIDCCAWKGSGQHICALRLDIIIISIVAHVNDIPCLQAIGLRQGLGQDTDPAPVPSFLLRKVPAFHNTGLLSGERRLLSRLFHRQYREAVVGDLHFLQGLPPKEALFRCQIFLRPALQLCHSWNAVVRNICFRWDKINLGCSVQIRNPLVMISFFLGNNKVPIPIRGV